MKAAILERINEPLVIGEVEPLPLNYGQVLVRILVSGICGAQIQELRGEKGNGNLVPHLLGHEACGMVEEIGPAVTNVKAGDKVVCHWRKGAGIESPFPIYRYKGEQITSGKVTTLCEQSVISENRLTRVPQDTPEELCALLGCGLSTALGTIEWEAKVKFGESVLIIGCGGLGLNLIRAAKMAQAAPVCAIDIVDSKHALAKQMGADQFGDYSWACSWQQKFDVVIDTSGSPEAISFGVSMLAPSGRFIMVGQPKPGAEVVLTNAREMFSGEGQSIRATQGGKFMPHLDIRRYVKLWNWGRLDLSHIVSHRISLDRINEGIDLVRNGQAGRVMVTII